jgi:hypothetical protein
MEDINAPSRSATLSVVTSGAAGVCSATVVRRVHESIVGDLLLTPTGLLLSCSDDQTIKTMLAESLTVLKTTSLDGTAINNLVMAGELLIATTDGGTVFVMNGATQDIRGRYLGHSSPVRACCRLSARVVATGDRKGEVRIWDTITCNTVSVNACQERILELAYDVGRQCLYAITESEVLSFQLDQTWFPFVAEQKDLRGEVGGAAAVAVTEPAERQSSMVLEARSSALPRAMEALNDIELARTGRPFELRPQESRFLRQFAEWRGGTRCSVALLSGGLSDARVLSVKVFDDAGAPRISAVAKIGSALAIRSEAERYDREVSRLRPEATPRRLEAPHLGDAELDAVFYSLADGYDQSGFDIAMQAPQAVPQVIKRICELTAPWRKGVPESKARIQDVRRRIVSDETYGALVACYSLDWAKAFEECAVQVRWCTVHGDFHGSNILVNETHYPIMVDYESVGIGCASFDAVSLEFSHLFHPDGPLRQGNWPTAEVARHWRTERYLLSAPMPELSRSCWKWADEVGAGHREIAAAGYGYLILQLTYPDTNKERVLHLLEGVRALYGNT